VRKIAFIDARDREAIPVLAHLRPGQAENLDRNAKFKHAQAIIGNDDDEGIDCGMRWIRDWHDIVYIWQSCHPP
jgi:hypothetical protein